MAAQYLTYLGAGVFYYFVMGDSLSFTAGFSPWMVLLLSLIIFVGGFAPGLSLFSPKWAAISGGIGSLLLMFASLNRVFFDPSVFLLAIPALISVGISVHAWKRDRKSIWEEDGNATTLILAAIPALLAFSVLGTLAMKLLV